ncbi:arrestin domain-containing protein 3 [Oryzias melastigma]|uniref:Arrestin domain-containing protein 3-like n=1 Tax=Oryzias melastigma TaxID=30732 RepID=A0A3B3BH84_ORYME|nr:arrestin domain-containing protein 3 [Oryzias melastigma]
MLKHSIQNFGICFDKPVVDGKSTFSKGDMVTGHISFDLSKDTSITSIRMKLKGGANVSWSRGSKNNRRTFAARVDFFTLEGAILQETRETISSGQNKLPAGTHVFPFSCQLPLGDFPSSFRGVHGEIKYTLTVTIHRPWHLSKEFVTVLNFVNHIDNSKPDLWAPLSGSNSKMLCCLCCASGPVTMTVMVEKAIFSPGETAKIFCEFSNASSKAASPWVKLLQRQTVYTLDQVSSSQACERLALVAGEHVMPNTSDVHTEIKLHIPSSASCTISNISILKVEYIIEVSLCILGSHELTVLFPIILCDKSTYNPPPFLS